MTTDIPVGLQADLAELTEQYDRAMAEITADELTRLYPVSTPTAPRTPSWTGEFGRGLRQGVHDVRTNLFALEGQGLKPGAPYLGPQGLEVASEATRESFLQELAARREQGQQFSPAVGSVQDINSFNDAALWGAGVLGQGIPILGSIVASGGVTGLGARGLAHIVGKQLSRKATGRFVTAGATAEAIRLETGSSIIQQVELDGDYHRGAAAISGALKGSLEAIVPLALGRRLGLSEAVAGRFLDKVQTVLARMTPGRIAAGAAAAGGVEGVTEFAQEVIDLATLEFVSENADFLGEEGAWRLLDAAAAGTLFGSVMGGSVAAVTERGLRENDPTAEADGTPRVPPEVMETMRPHVQELIRLLGTTAEPPPLLTERRPDFVGQTGGPAEVVGEGRTDLGPREAPFIVTPEGRTVPPGSLEYENYLRYSDGSVAAPPIPRPDGKGVVIPPPPSPAETQASDTTLIGGTPTAETVAEVEAGHRREQDEGLEETGVPEPVKLHPNVPKFVREQVEARAKTARKRRRAPEATIENLQSAFGNGDTQAAMQIAMLLADGSATVVAPRDASKGLKDLIRDINLGDKRNVSIRVRKMLEHGSTGTRGFRIDESRLDEPSAEVDRFLSIVEVEYGNNLVEYVKDNAVSLSETHLKAVFERAAAIRDRLRQAGVREQDLPFAVREATFHTYIREERDASKHPQSASLLARLLAKDETTTLRSGSVEGVVTYIAKDASVRDSDRQVAETAVDYFRKKFGLKGEVVLLLNNGQDYNTAPTAEATSSRIGPNSVVSDRNGKKHVVSLNTKSALFAHTLTHEMGHVVMNSEFQALPQKLKLALLTEYEIARARSFREVRQTKDDDGNLVDIDEFFAQMVTVPRAAMLLKQHEAGRLRNNSIAVEAMLSAEADYWLGFSEWMAESAAKYMAETAPGSTGNKLLDNFFLRLANVLQKAYRVMAEFWWRNPAVMQGPAPAFRDFMQYLQEGKDASSLAQAYSGVDVELASLGAYTRLAQRNIQKDNPDSAADFLRRLEAKIGPAATSQVALELQAQGLLTIKVDESRAVEDIPGGDLSNIQGSQLTSAERERAAAAVYDPAANPAEPVSDDVVRAQLFREGEQQLPPERRPTFAPEDLRQTLRQPPKDPMMTEAMEALLRAQGHMEMDSSRDKFYAAWEGFRKVKVPTSANREGQVHLSVAKDFRHLETPMLDVVTEVVNTFRPRKSLRILAVSRESMEEIGVNLAGAFFAHKFEGEHYLAVNLEPLLEGRDTAWAFTLMHELGHMLQEDYFEGLPAGHKLALLSAYNADRIFAQTQHSWENYSRHLASTTRFVTGLDSSDFDTPTERLSTNTDYWYGFEEWFAEQMVQLAESSARGVKTPAMGYVQTFANQYKKLMEIFEKRSGKINFPETFVTKPREVSGAFQEFANYISRTYEGVPPSLPETEALTAEDLIFQQQMAQRELGQNESREPSHPASQSVWNLLKKVDLPGKNQQQIGEGIDRFNWFMDQFWTLQQITKKNPHITPLALYTEYVHQWHVFYMQWATRADDTVRAWTSLGKGQEQALANLIHAVDSYGWLPEGELAARHPTEAELAKMANEAGVKEKAMDLYFRIQQDFRDVWDHIEQVTMRDLELTISTPEKLKEAKEKAQQDFANWRSRPYFPRARFGSFAISVRDEETNQLLHLEQYESHRQAKREKARLEKQFPKAKTTLQKLPEHAQVFRGLPSAFLAQIKDRLKLTTEEQAWLDDVMAEIAQGSGARRQLKARHDIPGHSRDAKRAYANYFFHGARHFARIQYGPLMEGEIKDLESRNRQAPHGTDATKAGRIRNYMRRHFDFIMNPQEDWASLRSMAFMWYLGFNVKSAVLNLTQVPMVAYPYLASRFNDAGAVSELMSAAGNVKDLYFSANPKMNETFLRMLDRARREGVTEESQAAELAAVSGTPWLATLMPADKLSQYILTASHWGGFFFQTSEKLNRRVVFRAAWELAQKNPDAAAVRAIEREHALQFADLVAQGETEQDARAYLMAKEAVMATQYQYAAHARPEFMRGKKGTIFTFFMFLQQTLWFAAHGGATSRFLLMTLAMGGLMGLPGAEDLASLARFGGRKLFGKDFDVDLEVRKLVREFADEDFPADLVLHGMSRYGFGLPAAAQGLGLPMPNVDLSGSISLGRVVPGMSELGTLGDRPFDQMFSDLTSTAAGAAFSMPLNMVRALSASQYSWDDFKRWERAMPSAARSVARSARWATEGKERDAKGATVVEFNLSDPRHMGEILGQALGFPPTRVQQKWSVIAAQREAETYWVGRRAILMTRYAAARHNRDKAQLDAALAQIQEFNRLVPFKRMGITRQDRQQSFDSRERARKQREQLRPQSNRFLPRSRQIQSLFPEVEGVSRIER